MRAYTRGRWVSRAVAVAAIGAGAFVGVAVIAVPDQGASGITTVADEATSDSPRSAGSDADGHEWT